MIGEFGSAGPLPSESTAADRAKKMQSQRERMQKDRLHKMKSGVMRSNHTGDDEDHFKENNGTARMNTRAESKGPLRDEGAAAKGGSKGLGGGAKSAGYKCDAPTRNAASRGAKASADHNEELSEPKRVHVTKAESKGESKSTSSSAVASKTKGSKSKKIPPGVLRAMDGTVQGKSGWYKSTEAGSGDTVVAYFHLSRSKKWIPVTKPVNEESWSGELTPKQEAYREDLRQKDEEGDTSESSSSADSSDSRKSRSNSRKLASKKDRSESPTTRDSPRREKDRESDDATDSDSSFSPTSSTGSTSSTSSRRSQSEKDRTDSRKVSKSGSGRSSRSGQSNSSDSEADSPTSAQEFERMQREAERDLEEAEEQERKEEEFNVKQANAEFLTRAECAPALQAVPFDFDTSILRTYPHRVTPAGAGMMKCFIVRDRSGLNKLHPMYTLWLDPCDNKTQHPEFILCGKKIPRNKTPHYRIFNEKTSDSSKGNSAFVGKLRGGFMGREYTMFDTTDPHKAKRGANTKVQRECGNVFYELDASGICDMEIVVPRQDGHTDFKTGPKARNPPCVLINKSPRLNSTIGKFVLNFKGRVTCASVKNFQLLDKTNKDMSAIKYQFGKVGKDKFVMDFGYPMSPYQAFCVALSKFDSKESN